MLITETKKVQREIHVAPCLECGSTKIALSDDNHSSFNQGGGECKSCGHKTYGGVGCMPSMDELASIWNAGNDIAMLVRAQRDVIAKANARIEDILAKTRINERGWICKAHSYGVWFMPWSAAVADWKADQKEHYGRDVVEIDEQAVESWFNEQMGWMEVARDGMQLKRPDMDAFEVSMMDRMKNDTDFVEDAEKIESPNGTVKVAG